MILGLKFYIFREQCSITYTIKRCFLDYLKIINFRKIWTERGATE